MPLPTAEKIISKKSSRDIVYEELQELIINGTLKPGEKLIETELTEYFGVSRTPIREALQLLREVRLVSIIPGQQTIVENIDLKEMEDCYTVLMNLQTLAITKAIPNIEEEDIKNLNTILDNFQNSSKRGSITEIVEQDNEFHNYIVNLSNNIYLKDFINILQLHVNRLKYFYFDEEQMINYSIEEHKEILDVIKERNIDQAKEKMENHWERVKITSLELAKNKLSEILTI